MDDYREDKSINDMTKLNALSKALEAVIEDINNCCGKEAVCHWLTQALRRHIKKNFGRAKAKELLEYILIPILTEVRQRKKKPDIA